MPTFSDKILARAQRDSSAYLQLSALKKTLDLIIIVLLILNQNIYCARLIILPLYAVYL